MLNVRGLKTGYDRSQVLFDMSFEVNAGEAI
jgi:branched-chain amino acid transport system ATP-binding protein